MFHFKHFSVDDDACAMKVGTDGVLLGAWCCLDKAQRILDLGTGSGLLALMMAQRTHNAQITAIEIDPEAAKQAQRNVEQTPWAHRIKVEQADFLQWKERSPYDAIVSNPPFFQETLLAPNPQKAVARHTRQGLTFERLIAHSSSLINPIGSLQVIIPKKLENQFVSLCCSCSLFLHRATDVCTVSHKEPKRVLLHFLKNHHTPPQHSRLVLLHDGERTAEYQNLCQNFYL